jgi:hypothetical protein
MSAASRIVIVGGVPNGGSRVTAVTSDHHAARLAFQSMSDPSAEYERLAIVLRAWARTRRLTGSVRPSCCASPAIPSMAPAAAAYAITVVS